MANHPDLSTSERLTFAAMSDFQNAEGQLWPSVATIAAIVGQSERQVQRNIEGLMQRGWVKALTDRKGGRGKATVYQLQTPTELRHPLEQERVTETQTQLCPGLQEKPRQKPRHFEAQRVTSEAVKGDIAVSPEVLEVFEVGKSSSSETVATVVEQQPTTATAALVSQNENREIWREIEAAIWKRVDGAARQVIEASIAEQGLSLKLYAETLKRYPISRKAKNPIGVLISRAKNLRKELSVIDPDDPEPPDEFGERMRDEYPYPSSDTCPICRNTGRLDEPHPVRTTVTKWCWYPSCKAGQQAKDDDELALANQLRTRPRDTWERKLIEFAAAGLDRKLIRSYVGLES